MFRFKGSSCAITIGSSVVATAERGHDGLYYVSSGQRPTALLTKAKETPQLWHRRYAHLGYDALAKLVRGGLVAGIDVPADAFSAAKVAACEPCIMAKQHRQPFGSSASKSTKPLQLVHMDVCGPLQEPSLGGSRYLATFLDDYTKLSVVRPIAAKSDVAAVVQEVFQMLETQCGGRVRSVRTTTARST